VRSLQGVQLVSTALTNVSRPWEDREDESIVRFLGVGRAWLSGIGDSGVRAMRMIV
jgi:hypothetical protein